MNDSNYATANMFDDEKELKRILNQWENDMPGKYETLSKKAPFANTG